MAAAVLAFGGIALLNKFSSIVVSITPHQEFINVDISLKAAVNPQANELPLEIMQISYREKGTAKATGTKKVSRKASGQIVIYNAYSSQTQTLVKNTRFQAPGGKIYRIDKSIIVPGAKIENGKITPSEIEATIYADEPGETYNSDLTDFIIPGFQEPAKREKIYARSKTKIQDGFVGEVSVIVENDIKNLETSLKEKVQNYLFKTAANPKPEDFLMYDNARKIVFEEQKNKPKPGDEANQFELTESATLSGFLLKKSDLNQTLAANYFKPEIAPQVVLIIADKLNFELKNSASESIIFSLKGQADFAWKIDESSIKNNLTKERKNPNLVFEKNPAVEKAKISYKPSWWKYIPQNPSQITAELILKDQP